MWGFDLYLGVVWKIEPEVSGLNLFFLVGGGGGGADVANSY